MKNINNPRDLEKIVLEHQKSYGAYLKVCKKRRYADIQPLDQGSWIIISIFFSELDPIISNLNSLSEEIKSIKAQYKDWTQDAEQRMESIDQEIEQQNNRLQEVEEYLKSTT